MAKQFREIETAVWKPENEGDKIHGILISKEPKTDDVGAKYQIENKDGAFLVWGSAVLDDKLQQVKVGSEVRITYTGQKKLEKGRKLNQFKVEIAYDDAEEKPAETESPAEPKEPADQQPTVEVEKVADQ